MMVDLRHLLSNPGLTAFEAERGLVAPMPTVVAIADPDWESKEGHYRVRLDGEWITVPDDAVITEPNRAGRTMVWPVKGSLGTSIRCFLPGSMT